MKVYFYAKFKSILQQEYEIKTLLKMAKYFIFHNLNLRNEQIHKTFWFSIQMAWIDSGFLIFLRTLFWQSFHAFSDCRLTLPQAIKVSSNFLWKELLWKKVLTDLEFSITNSGQVWHFPFCTFIRGGTLQILQWFPTPLDHKSYCLRG